MDNKIKFKGRVGLFFHWPVIITVALALLNVSVYANDVKSGVFVSFFILIYSQLNMFYVNLTAVV